MAAIEFKAVTKAYSPGHLAVDAVNLRVNDGEFAVFVGPSGCGKSTLLRMAAGLESITSGQILIGERVVNDLPPRLRDVAMVFQDYALYPHKTVYENLAFGLRMRKVPEATIHAKVDRVAELLRIGPMLQRSPAQLSGGQRQRVAIGRAIVREPQVFFFDEPLSNLDAQLRNEMRVEIKRLHRTLGATIVYVTHDQVEAMTMADRIAVMRGGHLMQYADPRTIYNQPQALFVAEFMGSPPMCTLALQQSGGRWCWPDGSMLDDAPLQARLAGLAGSHQRLVLGLRPEHIVTQPPAGEGQADSWLAVQAELLVLEPLGAETLATFEVGAARLIAKCPQSYDAPVGSRSTVYLDRRQFRCFDADSGVALALP